MLSVIESHMKPIREFFHALLIPCLDAKLGRLHTAEIHKCKLLWSGCDRIVKNAATENEILLNDGSVIFLICLLLSLDSVVS